MARFCVFVPGFLGSNLKASYPGWGYGLRIWLAPVGFTQRGYRLLEMSGLDPLARIAEVTPDGIVYPVYGDFTDWLGTKFDAVEHFAYDWRQPALTSAAVLSARLSAIIAGGNTLDVIGHSFGGRVAAAALRMLPANQKERVRMLATVGTPWRGSWRACEALAGKGTSVRLMSILSGVNSLSAVWYERGLIQLTISSWPALYELFPSEALQSQLSPVGVQNVYNPLAWFQGGSPVDSGKLQAAEIGQRTPIIPDPAIFHLNIFATGLPTSGPFEAGHHFAGSNLFATLDGDGVVCRESALSASLGVVLNVDTRGEHSRLCSSEGTRHALASHF